MADAKANSTVAIKSNFKADKKRKFVDESHENLSKKPGKCNPNSADLLNHSSKENSKELQFVNDNSVATLKIETPIHKDTLISKVSKRSRTNTDSNKAMNISEHRRTSNKDENHATKDSQSSSDKATEHVQNGDTRETSNHEQGESCTECLVNKKEIASLREKIQIINEKLESLLESSSTSSEKTKSQYDQMEAFINNNNTMADKVQSLEMAVEQISVENSQIQQILDNKQNEWQVIEKKNNNISKPVKTNDFSIETHNRFNALPTCEDIVPASNQQGDNNFNSQLHEYRKKQKSNFSECQVKEVSHQPSNDHLTPASKPVQIPEPDLTHDQDKNSPKPDQVYVFGDSMTKHIDSSKISKAAGVKSTSLSYSGAKISQIDDKLNQELTATNKKVHAIILHVGTNDLSNGTAEDAAIDMERCIRNAKKKADNVAVSGVIRRYDNKVSHENIRKFNKNIHDLCKKHQIAYINNDNIDKQSLNRSLLHLNKHGDRMLGGTFCSYLRSLRPGNNRKVNNTSNRVNFWKTKTHHPRHSIGWMNPFNHTVYATEV